MRGGGGRAQPTTKMSINKLLKNPWTIVNGPHGFNLLPMQPPLHRRRSRTCPAQANRPRSPCRAARRGRPRGAPRTRDGPHIDRGQPPPTVPVLRAQSEDLISGPSTALAPLRPARSQATRPSRLFRAESLQHQQPSAPGVRLRLLEPMITTAWTATADVCAYHPNSLTHFHAVRLSASRPRAPTLSFM